MNITRTRVLLAISLFSTVIAAWFAPAKDDGVDLTAHTNTTSEQSNALVNNNTATNNAVTMQTNSSSTIATPVDVLEISSRLQSVGGKSENRLFSPSDWLRPVPQVLPKPVVLNPLPVIPQVPPLPFRVLGHYEAAGKLVIFLQRENDNFVVKVGDTIDDQYRVESIDGDTMNLRYLPLNQMQSLNLGKVQ